MLYVHISLTLIPKTSSLTAATCTYHHYHDETWCLLLVDSMNECVLSQTVGHINEGQVSDFTLPPYDNLATVSMMSY